MNCEGVLFCEDCGIREATWETLTDEVSLCSECVTRRALAKEIQP